MEGNCSINCLPNEIIALILEKIDSREILRFGATCVRFNDFVKSNQYLWKDIAKRTMPEYLYNILQEYSEGNWLHELRGYHIVKKQIFAELISMSPIYYKQENEINIQDVKVFFKAALSSKFSYNYAIYIMQDLIRTGEVLIDTGRNVIKPYTMTELHYGKIVLRHLVHTFLALKWVDGHLNNELPPERVCNYFIQWVDTFSIHHDEHVEEKINELVNEVKAILRDENKETSDTSPAGFDQKKQEMDLQVLSAVTRVVYHKRDMAITTAANVETLDIIKVLQTNCGNVIVLTALYQAVAQRCGVTCELVAFPNHLFLEWRDHSDRDHPQVYTVDPASGALSRRRRCPFSLSGPSTKYRYRPEALLQYMCSSFHMSMGTIRNWNTHNALHLMDFLGTNLNAQHSFRYHLPSLLEGVNRSTTSPLNLKHMHHAYMRVMRSLSDIYIPQYESRKRYYVKKRNGDVKYAVGMECFHNKYDYVCVVRDWEPQCALKFQSQMIAENLDRGVAQPFYHVIAADQSQRYVPQENLDRLPRTFRMVHVEEVIAPEFTHFDGFAYVANDQKRAEYPDDEAVLDVYRARAEALP